MRIAGIILLAVALTSGACGRNAAGEGLPGVRLGMSPRDVRDRFDGGGAGTWQTRLGAGDDTILEWTAAAPTTRASQALFEFHLGMLVAIRAHLREAVASPQVDLTSKTVSLRAPQEGGTELTILARDCPTHHVEAEGLVARAR